MRRSITDKQVAAEVPAALAALLGIPMKKIGVRREDGPPFDLLVEAADHAFAVDVFVTPSAGPIVIHAERALAAAKKFRRKVIPLLVVPYMTEAGREAAARAGIPWIDLSGNAHIVAPALRVIVAGHPNKFRAPGRPSSVFAPKSARVVRWLLMHPDEPLTQTEIAHGTAMHKGFISRIVSRLLAEGYITRVGADGTGEGNSSRPVGRLRVKDRGLLLDAWRAEYRFDRHTLIQGTVAARSGDALTRLASNALAKARVEHAATGLAAAWQFDHFASFRIATFFVTEMPSDDLRARLGFREEARGANLWFVLPNDEGVFHGAETRDGVRCVHPVQAYMDLKAHPERAAEAAEHLRVELLGKRPRG